MEELVMKCRFCNTLLEKKFLDLGKTPLANSYLKKNESFSCAQLENITQYKVAQFVPNG